MKRVSGICLVLVVSVVLAGISVRPTGAAETKSKPKTVSLQVEHASLVDVCLQLYWQTGASIIATTSVPKEVNLTLDKVALEDALDRICEQVGYQWRHSGKFYLISPQDDPRMRLPSIEHQETYLLYPYQERADTAKLLATLSDEQWDVLFTAGLGYRDLTPDQQDEFTRLYQSAATHWLQTATFDPDLFPKALKGAKLPAADQLSIGLRTWVWTLD